MKRFVFYCGVVLAVQLLLSAVAEGQITISGPKCVVPGTVYQYIIGGRWDSSSTMQLQLAGGHLADTSKGKLSALAGRLTRQLLIVWTDSTSAKRSLSLTSAAGNTSLDITFTSTLQGGTVDSACTSQWVGLDSIPAKVITCAPASGGTCSPVYHYQWQQSIDRMHWTDIGAAIESNLSITTKAWRSTYYRRKVIETSSGSIGYSDEAAVFLHVEGMIPDSTLKAITDSAKSISAQRLISDNRHFQFYGQPSIWVVYDRERPKMSIVSFAKPKEQPIHG